MSVEWILLIDGLIVFIAIVLFVFGDKIFSNPSEMDGYPWI